MIPPPPLTVREVTRWMTSHPGHLTEEQKGQLSRVTGRSAQLSATVGGAGRGCLPGTGRFAASTVRSLSLDTLLAFILPGGDRHLAGPAGRRGARADGRRAGRRHDGQPVGPGQDPPAHQRRERAQRWDRRQRRLAAYGMIAAAGAIAVAVESIAGLSLLVFGVLNSGTGALWKASLPGPSGWGPPVSFSGVRRRAARRRRGPARRGPAEATGCRAGSPP